MKHSVNPLAHQYRAPKKQILAEKGQKARKYFTKNVKLDVYFEAQDKGSGSKEKSPSEGASFCLDQDCELQESYLKMISTTMAFFTL